MTSLLEAVRSNSIRLISIYLAVPQALAPRELHQALFLAAELGFVDVLRALMGAGVKVEEARDSSHNTPLYVAVSHNQAGAAKLLAELGPRTVVDGFSSSARNTPCHLAARLGYEECLRVLLEYGASVNVRDSSGCTPLILAVRYKRYGALKLLLESGCDVNVRDGAGRTALHYASQTATGVSLLLEAGCEVNVRDKDGSTPLLLAAAEGLSGVVKTLAATGRCDVNLAQTATQRTPLHLLAYKGHGECIPELIDCGADINLNDSQQRSALWYAVSNSRVDVVKLLLRANSQADTFRCPESSPRDACPVRLAFSKGLVKVLKLFILTGYDSGHLRECLAQPEAEQLFSQADLHHWLHHARDVMSLRSTCRKWIRHHLGYHFYHDLQQLPVPPAMRDYLFLKELDDDHD
ncbi:ankyrin repeat domain-containing protein 55-like isoform X2 [Babylonia areolata]|uniref:ankyrin repeat domain-containing protein 55-like isoform X2 n=1 Tax=Babylonia areolata TaxID=304850 RepID=UPI003FD195BC